MSRVIVLPNGKTLTVPSDATKDQVRQLSQVKDVMTAEEWFQYDSPEEAKQVADVYRKIDSVTAPASSPFQVAAVDSLVKPLAKFGYSVYKEPKRAAKVLPDVLSMAGAGAVASLASPASLIGYAALIATGSGLGAATGKAVEGQILTGETETSDVLKEGLGTAGVELFVGALPPVVKKAVEILPYSGQTVFKGVFKTDAQAEITKNLQKKLTERGTTLLPSQIGEGNVTLSNLTSAAASGISTGKIQATLKAQNEYLEDQLEIVLNEVSKESARGSRVEIGATIQQLYQDQKDVNMNIFKDLYKDRLKGNGGNQVDLGDFSSRVRNILDEEYSKYSTEYPSFTKELENKTKKIRDMNLKLNELNYGEAADLLEPEELARQKKELKYNLNIAKEDLKELQGMKGLPLKDSEYVKILNSLMNLKQSTTVDDLMSVTMDLKDTVAKVKNEKGQQPRYFNTVVKLSEALEEKLLKQLPTDVAKDYKALNKAYKENLELMYDTIVTGLIEKNIPEAVADAIIQEGNVSYYKVFDRLADNYAKVNRNNPKNVKTYKDNVEKSKQAVKHLFLAKAMQSDKELLDQGLDETVTFGYLNRLSSKVKNPKFADTFQEMFGKDEKLVGKLQTLLTEFGQLSDSLKTGKFSLLIPSMQSQGLKDLQTAMPTTGVDINLGITGNVLKGFVKMFSAESLSGYLTNPKRVNRMISATQTAEKAIRDNNRMKFLQAVSVMAHLSGETMVTIEENNKALEDLSRMQRTAKEEN